MQFHAKYVPAIETSYKEKENVDNKKKKTRIFICNAHCIFS